LLILERKVRLGSLNSREAKDYAEMDGLRLRDGWRHLPS